MQHRKPSQTVVVKTGDATIEIVSEGGNVHLSLDQPSAVLDARAADDLVHAVLEAMAGEA
jgi:hypothetical protein